MSQRRFQDQTAGQLSDGGKMVTGCTAVQTTGVRWEWYIEIKHKSLLIRIEWACLTLLYGSRSVGMVGVW